MSELLDMSGFSLTSWLDPVLGWFADQGGLNKDTYVAQTGGEGIAVGIEILGTQTNRCDPTFKLQFVLDIDTELPGALLPTTEGSPNRQGRVDGPIVHIKIPILELCTGFDLVEAIILGGEIDFGTES